MRPSGLEPLTFAFREKDRTEFSSLPCTALHPGRSPLSEASRSGRARRLLQRGLAGVFPKGSSASNSDKRD